MSSKWIDFFMNLGSGVLGGICVLLFQKYMEKRNKRQLHNNIINNLYPEKNFQKVFELFGEPNYSRRICSDESDKKEIFSIVYTLNNATIKILTLNKEVILATTVISDDNKISIPFFRYWNDNVNEGRLGSAKINQKIIQEFTGAHAGTMRDGFHFIFQKTIPAPDYKNIYYFCDAHLDEKINDLEGRVIVGFAIADYALYEENIDEIDLYIYEREKA